MWWRQGPSPSTKAGKSTAREASLSHFPLHFLVTQTPAELQVHHAQVDPYRRCRPTQTRIERLFKRFQQLRIRQKLIDLLQFFVQFVKRSVDKTITKTHLLRYGPA